MAKVDVFLKLRKDNTSGEIFPIAANSIGFVSDQASERFGYAVIKFQIETDDTIFDPVVDTGLTIAATRQPIDTEAVVRGLRKVKSEIRRLEAS
jgi:hypothetical protein